jgi:hypothetical protein
MMGITNISQIEFYMNLLLDNFILGEVYFD